MMANLFRLKHPSSNIQAPEKFQTPNVNAAPRGHWSLMLGIWSFGKEAVSSMGRSG
jgi:hypothetical protein